MRKKINCKQAVDLISKKEEGKISASQRFALWRHLGECSLCRIFSVQNKIIEQALGNRKGKKLSDAEKENIILSVIKLNS